MLKQNAQTPTATTGTKTLLDSKPGSEPAHANLPHDFGANVNDVVERDYASHTARGQDPGHTAVRSSDERGGRRDAGVGVDATNAGAGSGGDLDTDVVGIGGRGLSINIPDAAERDHDGPDRVDSQATPLADHVDPLGANDEVRRGGTVTYDRDSESENALNDEGADAIKTGDLGDPYADATSGEVSRGESAGPGDSSSSSARR